MKKWNLGMMLMALMVVLALSACNPKPKISEPATPPPAQKSAQEAKPAQAPSPTAAPAKAEPTTKPNAAPTAKPADTVAPSPTAEPEEKPVALKALDDLQSYKETIIMTTREQGKPEMSWTITILYDGAIPASHQIMSGTDEDGTEMAWEVIRIKDATYTRLEDQWLVTEGADSPISADLLGWARPDNFMASGECKRQGNETIDGQRTTHYRCDQKLLASQTQSALIAGKIDKAQIDIWVAEKLNTAVKMLMTWSGADADGVKVEYDYALSLTDINQPVKIEQPPVDIEAGAAPDIPTMDGAANRTAMPGMVTYQVAKPITEVSQFYTQEMEKGGWALAKDESMLPNMLSYKQGKRSAMIVLNDIGGSTQVMITSQEE